MAEPNPPSMQDNPDVRHEHSDVSIRGIVIFAAGLLVAAIVIHIGLYGLLEFYRAESPPPVPVVAAPGAREQIPPPRLQISPRGEMAEMRAAQERQLATYGWVSKEKQIIRVPIERAMELLVQRGLPSRKPAEQESRKK